LSIEAVGYLSAATVDQNFFLDGTGLGLFEHPGVWLVLLGDLVILGLLAKLLRQFEKLPTRIPTQRKKNVRRYTRLCIRKVKTEILLRGSKKSQLAILSFLGFILFLNNAMQTTDPFKYYGNDLFDSIYHPWSYVAVRVAIFSSWVIVYPFCIFGSLVVGLSIRTMLEQLSRRGYIGFSIYHPDKCGGFAHLGNINLIFLTAIFVIYIQQLLIWLTHGQLNPGLFIGLISSGLAFLFLSFFLLLPLLVFLKSKRTSTLNFLYKNIMSHGRLRDMHHHSAIHSQVNFSPYPIPQKILLMAFRLIPAGIGAAKILLIT